MKNRILLFLVLLAFLSMGCKSKKKLVEKEKTTIEKTTAVEETTKVETTKTLDSVFVEKKETITLKENEAFEVEADSTATVTILEEITPTGRKLTFTGAKRIRVTSAKENTTQKDSTAGQVLKTENEIEETTKKEETAESSETESTSIDITKKGFNPWFLGILPILILLYLIWRYRKRLFSWLKPW